MEQPLVSIVTPVYNAEKYLVECIESVLAQTYQNWEYVIVNNCSKDRSLEIAQRYAAADSRIRVYDNDSFLSAIQNWNAALRHISPDSRYCKVVHADDWLFPECLARMVELAVAHPSIGLVSAYRLNEDRVDLDGLPYASRFMPGREIARLSLLRGDLFVFGSPTSLLLRADLVRQRPAFYNEASIHADTEVCYDLLQAVDFGFVHQVLTYTRRHNESMTSITNRFNTQLVNRLVITRKYGPLFLSPAEFERRWRERLNSYHAYLARNVYELREKEFWQFHKGVLRELGVPWSRRCLLRPLFFTGVDHLLHFRRTAEALWAYFKKGRNRTAADVKKLEMIANRGVHADRP